jgi:uncharacterized membrane protein YdbT with pleckstrin-like domain
MPLTNKGNNMGYIQESLSAGEEAKGLFKLHWVARLWMVLWIVLAVPTIGITLIFALWEWLKLRNIEQGVTNKRVILKTGIISRQTEEMKLSSVETVEIKQGVLGRILNFGTVRVTGRGISDVIFEKVADPMSVKKAIESIGIPAN